MDSPQRALQINRIFFQISNSLATDLMAENRKNIQTYSEA